MTHGSDKARKTRRHGRGAEKEASFRLLQEQEDCRVMCGWSWTIGAAADWSDRWSKASRREKKERFYFEKMLKWNM